MLISDFECTLHWRKFVSLLVHTFVWKILR